MFGQAARNAVLGLMRGKAQPLELFQQQTRRMGGGHGPGAPQYRSLDGKPPPPEFQTDEFVTYAGLTLAKPKADFDYWYTKAFGSIVWFTLIYHFSMNWEEHWHGDIGFFERDVQKNGWDDEHGHGHDHGHKHH